MTGLDPSTTATPADLARILRVNAACERFESAWRGGRSPRIEDHLGEATGPERAALLRELVALDWELREAAGERPAAADYLARFPGDGPAIEAEVAAAGRSPAGVGVQATMTHVPDPDETVADPASRKGEGGAAAILDAFGKYQLLGVLGRGGMGVVYKAWQVDLQRVVAIKMIHAVHNASAELVRRFRDEARCAGGLNHPNIVRVHEAGEVDGRLFFAMEYIAGPSLDQLLKSGGPLDPKVAAQHVAEVARAVAYLHERDVVHRDLKPSNILLDERGRPCVTDFGLVKLLGDESHQTVTGAVMGTPSHMAPEQAHGRPERVGPPADVYGLGAILYSLLAGRPPFLGPTQFETLVMVLESEPVPPGRHRPGIPGVLELVCLRCLEKDPAARYPSATALAEVLERFLRGEEVECGRPGLVNQVRRWARREPALATRLGVALACAAASVTHFAIARDIAPWRAGCILAILAAWAASAAIFQHLVNRGRRLDLVRMGWLSADVLLLSGVLIVADAFRGPLVVAYPVLIAGAGLWFRVRLVMLTTALSIAVYGGMALSAYFGPLGLAKPHWHIIFETALAVLGLIVAYQVQRVRALSRYYENRPDVGGP